MRLLLVVVLLSSGCASLTPAPTPAPARRVIRVDVPFDTAQAKRLLAPGPNRIHGSALLRQRGGGVVTCAGMKVLLVPATAYARERFGYYYGSGETGVIRDASFDIESPQIDPAAWNALQRETLCDAQGYFSFDKLADGEFFVLAAVQWVVAGENQGAAMMRRVKLSGGESKEIVITAE